jgi:hypothetical protein
LFLLLPLFAVVLFFFFTAGEDDDDDDDDANSVVVVVDNDDANDDDDGNGNNIDVTGTAFLLLLLLLLQLVFFVMMWKLFYTPSISFFLNKNLKYTENITYFFFVFCLDSQRFHCGTRCRILRDGGLDYKVARFSMVI